MNAQNVRSWSRDRLVSRLVRRRNVGTWQLQDAKARLSEVIATAQKQGPQIITQRGVKTAVVVPFEEWEKTPAAPKRTLLEILQSGPKGPLPIPSRRSWKMRKLEEL